MASRLAALLTAPSRQARVKLGGALATVVVAAMLFSRVGIDGFLFRDEAIYAYGGQQMTHGVAPYESVFDPKGPMATFICGLAAAIAHVFGSNDLTMMRLAFYACSIATALGVFLLVLQIWGSVVGAVAAGVVFASFRGFAQDALRGPDAHTAGPLFAVFAMWLALRRNWFWAAFAGSLATLVKQTYAPYALAVLVAAVLYTAEGRLRALMMSVAGALTPFIGTFLYFVAEGAVGRFYESAILFPARGLHPAKNMTVPQRLKHLVGVVWRQYNFSGLLFWIGTILLVAVALGAVVVARSEWRSVLLRPAMLIVGATMVVQWIYVALDFISYDDLYQLLPYAAVGFGAAVSLALRRWSSPLAWRALTAGTLAAALVLTALSWTWFTDAQVNNHRLPAQRAMGCALNRVIPAGTRLYAVGDPVPLVLTHRRNPDRYIYLESGVAGWKIKHTRGGMAGWIRQVTSPRNSAITFMGWVGGHVPQMLQGIRQAGYARRFVGTWRVFLSPAALRSARVAGIYVTKWPTQWPLRTSGAEFRVQSCGGG